MKSLSWINCVLGLWLIGGSFAISARTGVVRAEESVAGIAIAVLAYVSAVGEPSEGISWGVAAAGAWALIFNAGGGSASKVNAFAVGLTVAILGTINAIHRHWLTHTHA